MDFTRWFSLRSRGRGTPQDRPIPGTAQVPNAAGGYAWALTDWQRLERFLVLGTEGGTFYVGERELTVEAAEAVRRCIAADGPRAVHATVEVSASGRAARNDPALFVLALAAAADDAETRAQALAALPSVARTGTHLLHFLRYVSALRGWGRGVRRAVAAWYTAREPRELAYQLLKYPSRDGWSHRDALRLAHPRPAGAEQAVLLRRAAGKPADTGGEGEAMALLRAVDALHREGEATPASAAAAIRAHRLTREMVPTRLLAHAEVWEALLEGMPAGALLRSLGAMAKAGLLVPGAQAVDTVVRRLGDAEALRRARVHPVAVLSALRIYAAGRGFRGRNRWEPAAPVVDALDGAFRAAFGAVEPTGKRTMLALDVSGSMDAPVHGLPFLSCREAAAAMALVTAAVEPRHLFTAFTSGPYRAQHTGWTSGLTALSISPRQRLDDVVAAVRGLPFGGTDCALPMREALKHRWEVDTFVVYTDNETWAGEMHPAEALRRYRDRTGIAAKLVVVGIASTGFTIADPQDAGMLDVVGFDAAAPQAIAQFAR